MEHADYGEGTTSLIDSARTLYGFSLNYKRGKTEAIVHLARVGAREAATQLSFGSKRQRILVFDLFKKHFL